MSTVIGKAVGTLQVERTRLVNQVRNLDLAISAMRHLGKFASANGKPRSRMSNAARRRIAAAQRARWSAWRKKQK
jgi:hypothetical protein